MRNLGVTIEPRDLIAALKWQTLDRLVVLRRGSDPALAFFFVTANDEWIEFSVEMEPIAEREEIGRMSIKRTDAKSENDLGPDSWWNYIDIELPDWMSKEREIHLLRACALKYSVDTGIKIFNSLGFLTLRASSFPARIEIEIMGTQFHTRDSDAEFPIASLRSIPFIPD